MNRASPVQLRKALEAAQAMVKAGILFVPMPVANEDEFNRRANEANDRLERMAKDAEAPATEEE